MSSPLKSEPIHRLLLKYCIPAIISMMTVSLYNTVDRIFIGHIPEIGNIALTSLGTVLPFITLILASELLITYGVIANLSLKLGEKKEAEAQNFLNQVPVLGLLISLLLIFIFTTFKAPLLTLFGATKTTLPLATQYLDIMILGIPFYIIGFSLMASIRSEGNPKRAALILIASCLINVILDPIFIFTFDLGIAGAAIATVISYLFVFAYVFYYYTRGASNLKLKPSLFKPRRTYIIPILIFGLSTSLVQIMTALVQILFNRSLAHYGTPLSIGAFTTITTITNLALMPAIGINQGCVPIIGYNYGQRRFDRVKSTFILGTLASTVIFMVGYILIQLIPEHLVRFFNSDEMLLTQTVSGLKYYLFTLPLCALATTAPNLFQAIGQSRISIGLVVLRQLILLVPLIIFLPTFFGLTGVWIAQPITDLIISLLAFYLVKQEFKHY